MIFNSAKEARKCGLSPLPQSYHYTPFASLKCDCYKDSVMSTKPESSILNNVIKAHN